MISNSCCSSSTGKAFDLVIDIVKTLLGCMLFLLWGKITSRTAASCWESSMRVSKSGGSTLSRFGGFRGAMSGWERWLAIPAVAKSLPVEKALLSITATQEEQAFLRMQYKTELLEPRGESFVRTSPGSAKTYQCHTKVHCRPLRPLYLQSTSWHTHLHNVMITSFSGGSFSSANRRDWLWSFRETGS